MPKKTTISVFIGVVVGAVIGLFIGMDIGGNFYTDFVFNGLRGYEATGQIGAIAGGVLGGLFGYVLSRFIRNRKAK
jgi:hypothetical protein